MRNTGASTLEAWAIGDISMEEARKEGSGGAKILKACRDASKVSQREWQGSKRRTFSRSTLVSSNGCNVLTRRGNNSSNDSCNDSSNSSCSCNSTRGKANNQ